MMEEAVADAGPRRCLPDGLDDADPAHASVPAPGADVPARSTPSRPGGIPAWLRHSAQLRRMAGSTLHAPLQRSFIGERCLVIDACGHAAAPRLAQTVGFTDDGVVLSLLGDSQGLSTQAWIVPTGLGPQVSVSDATLGSVLDANGQIVRRLAPAPTGETGQAAHRLDVDALPPGLHRRRPATQRFDTGVRAIDGLMTCGVGQRVGIFAPAGAGKTSLVSMLVASADADVYIIGLVGERGREAAEFVEDGIAPARRARTVIVSSTSDRPPAERRNATHVACALAEHYRDAGCRVMLVIDSVTRYARALRELALASGEPPARRGYPASVFEALPRLLERAGAFDTGSITAFYTVLLEDEDQTDPLAEEVRSILDGHIVLSRTIAARGHFPAIDVLKSASRVMHRVTDAPHRAWAATLRGALARLADLQMLLDLGEYRPGENPDTDHLIGLRPALDTWLQQPIEVMTPFNQTREALRELAESRT
nr:FliI/YscN family ATPase [Burkholderia ambifaria]